jgi:MinD superfamily P-loop ATPase
MAGKKKTERTQIWLFGGEKGGMGKSMVGRVCAEQLLAAKVPFHLVDADASTPNVGLTYANELYQFFKYRLQIVPPISMLVRQSNQSLLRSSSPIER